MGCWHIGRAKPSPGGVSRRNPEYGNHSALVHLRGLCIWRMALAVLLTTEKEVKSKSWQLPRGGRNGVYHGHLPTYLPTSLPPYATTLTSLSISAMERRVSVYGGREGGTWAGASGARSLGRRVSMATGR